MDSAMLDFELNEQEKEKLQRMQLEITPPQSDNLDKETFKNKFVNYLKEVKLTYEQAHKRSLKYYKTVNAGSFLTENADEF